MSDIKKTALVILIIAILSNTFTQYAYAANDYDHNELMQYEGYGKAMYESIVEQTTFITGQYTDNREYVSDSINEIKDYVQFWRNQLTDEENCAIDSPPFSCIGSMVERGGAYVLTVGDWIKKFFSDYEMQDAPVVDDSAYSVFVKSFEQNTIGFNIILNENYGIRLTRKLDGVTENLFGAFSGTRYSTDVSMSIRINRSYVITSSETFYNEEAPAIDFSSVSGVVSTLDAYGIEVDFIFYESGEWKPSPITPNHKPVTNINNYIQENPVEIPVPQLAPTLVCPDGKRIKMAISGSTFISVNGETMLVNKDGTAEVNGSICNLNWEKPTVQYTPDGKVQVIQPDGTVIDDDGITKPDGKVPGFTDLEGCEGVMCGIAKVLDGLGSVVGSIADMVKDLLEGLLKLFVPDDLSFLKDEFSRIMESLNKKIPITNDLKEAITSVFNGGGGNPLADISLNLPITNESLSFGNVSFIEEGVPILRKVISAIVVLYTIVYVYRKITGRGGVMER